MEQNAKGVQAGELLKQAYEAMYNEKERKKVEEERTDAIEGGEQLLQEEPIMNLESDIT